MGARRPRRLPSRSTQRPARRTALTARSARSPFRASSAWMRFQTCSRSTATRPAWPRRQALMAWRCTLQTVTYSTASWRARPTRVPTSTAAASRTATACWARSCRRCLRSTPAHLWASSSAPTASSTTWALPTTSRCTTTCSPSSASWTWHTCRSCLAWRLASTRNVRCTRSSAYARNTAGTSLRTAGTLARRPRKCWQVAPATRSRSAVRTLRTPTSRTAGPPARSSLLPTPAPGSRTTPRAITTFLRLTRSEAA
mmetsp:Transcript_28569/g.84570  ORF Transcript_28569/g.84570 Transcript_28569/m.84570 type:complete len:256 (+) Transcript_28569:557-1324(+)